MQFPLAVINESVAPDEIESQPAENRPRSSDMKGLNSFLAISENTQAGQIPDIKPQQVADGEEGDVLEDLNQLNNLLYATKDYSKKDEWFKAVPELPPAASFKEQQVEAKSRQTPELSRFNLLSQLSSVASADNEPQEE